MQAEEIDDPGTLATHHTVLDRCRAEGRMLWAMVAVRVESGVPLL